MKHFVAVFLITSLVAGVAGCRGEAQGPADTSPSQQNQLSNVDPLPPEPQRVVAAYLPDYAMGGIDPEGVELQPITDIIYFGVNVSGEDPITSLKIDPQHLAILKRLKERGGCRLLLCAGGWGRSDGFALITAEPMKRQAFIKVLLNFCQSHGFDGIDYDWEHPQDDQQRSDYATLVKETSEAFDESGLLVTAALAPWQDLGAVFYESVDRVHLMSYDQGYPHATMDQARADVERLRRWGCSLGKIALGIPLYGRNEQGHAKSYRQLIKQTGEGAAPDVIAGYAHNGPSTVEAKSRWAQSQGLAGVMVWELTQDSQDQSLLRSIQRGIDESK